MRRLVEVREIAADPAAVALLKAWWDAAGPTLARAARPAGVSGGVLELVVGDHRWQRQVEEVREVLLDRLRHRKGIEKIGGIRVVIDPHEAVHRGDDRPEAVPATAAPEEILRAAQLIDDASLKERLCGAIGRHLQRRAAGKLT
ncbi:MAG TPA: DciA family protein [Candidatus Polarisedimenticolia bacterium]|nr:DciA family protein [Candidatus Polarisedimenticolia bacterium]